MIMSKNLLSFFVITVFALLAVASAAKKKLVSNSIAHTSSKETVAENGNYVIKNDGTRLDGADIKWSFNSLGHSWVKVDGQKFDSEEIRGIRTGSVYYGRVPGGFAQRIIHGKVNVYLNKFRGTRTQGVGGRSSYEYETIYYYCQVGEEKKAEMLKSYDHIKEFISDCPLALSMLQMGKKEIKQAIKADGTYLNKVFETYNNDCKTP
jgi:hypothetical protein